ncbi:MAG TPA: cytochrome c [Pseudolabrys sp.]|nr:cytochrome c [Pseudolabrys sp.]
MTRTLLLLAAVAAVVAVGLFWVLTIPQTVSESALGAHKPNLDNGRTLFFIGGCASCHATYGDKDPSKLGGRMTLETPFGNFYPPNISPDPDYGIGRWTEVQFVSAMTKGTADDEHLYPVFPYPSYQRMTTNDLRDLFAFLKTLPKVTNTDTMPPQEGGPTFPFNIRRFIGLWKLLFLDGLPFQPDPQKPDDWNRGAYLVNGPGHCAECHSPRNFLGAIKSGMRFTGGPTPDGKDWVPNITQYSLGKWSESDIAEMLATGKIPGDRVGGAMVDVVRNTAQLSPEDRQAIAVYIKSLPPVQGLSPPRQQ